MARHTDIHRLHRNPHIVVASLAANVLGLALPLAMIQVFDRIIPNQGFATLSVLAMGLACAAVFEFLLRMARGHLVAQAGLRFETYAYKKAIEGMLRNDLRGSLMDQGTCHDKLASIERVRKHHGSEAATALLDIPFIVMFILVIGLISPVLAVAVCGFAGVSVCFVRMQQRQILNFGQLRQDRDRRRHSFLVETLDGIEMIKSFGIEALMQRRYEKLMSVSAFVTHQVSGRVNFTQGMTAAIGLLAPVFMAGIGSAMVIAGQMSVGGLAAAVLLTGRVIQPTLRIEALLAGERDIRKSARDVNELVYQPAPQQGQVRVPKITNITLRNASLVLEQGSEPVLKSISARFEQGDCILLDGIEGSGRTMLLSLLAGHVQPTGGKMLVNGTPSDQVVARDLSHGISLLSSEYSLLDGTLLENMTAFEPAKFTETAFALSEELGIKDFITRHSDGLSMRVAARSTTSLPKSVHDGILLISGLVRAPDVILFDEANQGLDRLTDLKMIDILRRRIPSTIIFMVTHRPSYKALATRRFTVANGRLTEQAMDEKTMQVAS